MFERFTDRARRAIVAAQDEARGLDHSYIGTEHILLGLLDDGQSIAGVALTSLGITKERTRSEVVQLIGTPSGTAPSGHIPFTPRSKKVLELALREALGLGHNYIGTEHIVLGIVREGDGVAMQVIERQGVSGERLREQVLTELGRAPGGRGAAPKTPATTPGADTALAAARELAAGAPMGTHHLLEALALTEGSVAANVLSGLGVDADGLAARIDEVSVDGTSDVTPELAAARQLEVHLDDEAVRIVLGDDTIRELVGRLVQSMGNPIRGDGGDADSLIALWRANVTALREIAARLAPAGAEDAAGAGRAASVRAAIRNRLRRRDR